MKTPAGSFTVRTTTVKIAGGATLTFDIEATGAHRIVRWRSTEGESGELIASKRLPYWKLNSPSGESGELIASKRLPYWKLNSPSGEAELKGLGLKAVARF